jgi:hypothetical protein
MCLSEKNVDVGSRKYRFRFSSTFEEEEMELAFLPSLTVNPLCPIKVFHTLKPTKDGDLRQKTFL